MHPTLETPPERSTPASKGYLNLTDILAFLLRNLRLLIFLPLATAIGLASLFLLSGRPYAAYSTFSVATSGTNLSRLAGLAAQFGMAFGNRPTESVDFYAALLRSGDVLREVALSEYTVVDADEPSDTIRANLLELLPAKGKTEARQVKSAVRRLRKRVGVSTDLFSGTVSLKVVHANPDLAEQIARRLLDIADRYNVERRKAMAADERAFFEERVAEAQAELQEAERALEAFMLENRSFQSSPSLRYEAAKLQRQVDLRQQVYFGLVQAYDQARVDEVRNTATISIIESPEGTSRPATRLLHILFMGGFFGGFIALSIAGFREFTLRQRESDPERYRELEELWHTARRRVLIPFGR